MSRSNDSSLTKIVLVIAIAIVLFVVIKFVLGLLWKILFWGVVLLVAVGGAWYLVDRFLSKGKH